MGTHVRTVQDKAALRSAAKQARGLIAAVTDGATITEIQERATAIVDRCSRTCTTSTSLEDIPDLSDVEDKPISYLVDELIESCAVTLLVGEPKAGKSHLALRLAVNLAQGIPFLGLSTIQTPVIYLDRENPLHTAKSRHSLFAHGTVSTLKVWGRWLNNIGLPPLIGDPLWLSWAREHKPLFIFDSLVRFKGTADENSASEMAPVMENLRNLADVGASVLVIHHRAKGEGSRYRGSSDIFASVDCLLTLDRTKDGLLCLKREATRNGADAAFTIRADYESGQYNVADAPEKAKRDHEIDAIVRLIADTPGLSQSDIIQQLHIGRNRGVELLRSNCGNLWRAERGDRGSLRYFPVTCTEYQAIPGIAGTPGPDRYRCTGAISPVHGTGRNNLQEAR